MNLTTKAWSDGSARSDGLKSRGWRLMVMLEKCSSCLLKIIKLFCSSIWHKMQKSESKTKIVMMNSKNLVSTLVSVICLRGPEISHTSFYLPEFVVFHKTV